MTIPQTIALDAMGGDFGPDVIVAGAAAAQSNIQGQASFLFFGDEAKIAPVLSKFPALKKTSDIVHTDKKILSSDKPSTAIRNSKDSSMRLAIEAVKEGRADSIVSAGNTGALMALCKMILKTLPGIERPAIASVFPTMDKPTVMLDLGANLECDEKVLVQFALLGATYARVVMGVDNPSVGLLNIGTEDMKGHEEIRDAAAILSSIKFHGTYHGFVEGNDITKGTVNVVVSDGFTGNIALKTAEGTGKFTAHILKEAFHSSPLAMIGYVFASSAMKALKARLDPQKYNGGMFLGLDGIAVKSHGGSNILGTKNAILVAANLVSNGFNKRVADEISNVMNQMKDIKSETESAAQ